jgi:predicted transglutaminase-like cysteine proteinase
MKPQPPRARAIAFAIVFLAVWWPAQFVSGETIGAPPHMTPGEFALAPIQFTVFCTKKPERCASTDDVRKIAYDDESRHKIDAVNRGVNRSIAPFAHPPDVPWQDDATIGDCNEYALAKRSQLLDLNFPASALLLAVAVVPSGEAHLVLVVATDQGDFVLDSLRQRVVRWDKLPYRWIRRSSPTDPKLWQFILSPEGAPPTAHFDDNELIVGSVRGGRGLDTE